MTDQTFGPKFAAAFVAAQSELRAITKDSANPHFKSKYASLDAIISAVRPALAGHGLAVTQSATSIDDGRMMLVETRLIHTSGEWLSSSVAVPIAKQDPQGAGSALTYSRRYGLSALLSLATDDDDDGNAAAQPKATAERTPAPRAASSGSNGASDGKTTVKVMPFGKTKGKALVDLPNAELEKTLKWATDTDAEKFKDLIASIRWTLNDRALGIKNTAEVDDDGFPVALRDEADSLPF